MYYKSTSDIFFETSARNVYFRPVLRYNMRSSDSDCLCWKLHCHFISNSKYFCMTKQTHTYSSNCVVRSCAFITTQRTSLCTFVYELRSWVSWAWQQTVFFVLFNFWTESVGLKLQEVNRNFAISRHHDRSGPTWSRFHNAAQVKFTIETQRYNF